MVRREEREVELYRRLAVVFQLKDAVGAAMVRGLFGNLGQAMTQNVQPTVDIYRVEVMLSALDSPKKIVVITSSR